MADAEDRVLAGVYPELCPECCGYLHGQSIGPFALVTTMEAVKSGWIATGEFGVRSERGEEGFYTCTGKCINCGGLYRAIAQIVPIEIEPYPCPTCDSVDNMILSILSVSRVGDRENQKYRFKARYKCASCNKSTLRRKLFSWVGVIKKVTIGPSGISIEAED